MTKSLIDLDQVMSYQKKSANFTHDLNFIASSVSAYYLKKATNEVMSDEELALLKNKIKELIIELESILN